MSLCFQHSCGREPTVALPPAPLGRKQVFDLSQQEFAECSAKGGVVRALLMEQPGRSLGEHVVAWWEKVENPQRLEYRHRVEHAFLKEVVAVTTDALGLLKLIHQEGVVHGDIQENSFAFGTASGRVSSLLLTNFRTATLMCGSDESSNLTPAFAFNVSPWQLEGDGERGFRDDIFLLLEMTANMFSFNQLSITKHSFSDRESLRLFKMNADIFGSVKSPEFAYDCFSRFDNIAPAVVGSLKSIFNDLLAYGRSIPEPSTFPDFELMQIKLWAARDLLDY